MMALEKGSLASSLALLPPGKQVQVLEEFDDSELERLFHDWRFWARPDQLPPQQHWSLWIILAGRGWGKTRTGAEWVLDQVIRHNKKRIALVARTASDARDTLVEGESGILNISPPWNMPIYEPSKRRLTWPRYKARAFTYTADEPDRLRGPNHDAAWCDELAAWRYDESWDNLKLSVRLGCDTKIAVTTTPKPIPRIKELVRRTKREAAVFMTKGSTHDNLINLSPKFRQEILASYEGTRLGRQELYAEILDDAPGALWSRADLEEYRLAKIPVELKKVTIGVDPSVGDPATAKIAECGIQACGLGVDGHGYYLGDHSIKASPKVWAKQAVSAYHQHKADDIVAEGNNGGELVKLTIHTIDANVPVNIVYASRGKRTRAQPVSSLSEQGKIHHIGYFVETEDQLCQWEEGDESPDRLDAYVWGFTHLMVTAVTGGSRKIKMGGRK
jgi:phage terminase large subunit-like protein